MENVQGPAEDTTAQDNALLQLDMNWISLPDGQPCILLGMWESTGKPTDQREKAYVVHGVDAGLQICQFKVQENTFGPVRMH